MSFFRRAWIAGVAPATLGVLYLTIFPRHYRTAGFMALGFAVLMVALSVLALWFERHYWRETMPNARLISSRERRRR